MVELTEAEAAVYDRQLRVWGLEVQKRLNAARVLIYNCSGLGAEVAKNLVLAGISVSLADDARTTEGHAQGNFLVCPPLPEGKSVAEASADALQEMNPLVTVSALPVGGSGPEAMVAAADGFNVVVDINPPLSMAVKRDAALRAAGKSYYAAYCRGPIGLFFADLGPRHEYTPTNKAGSGGGGADGGALCTAEFSAMSAALATPWKGLNVRKTHKMWFLLCALHAFECKEGRPAEGADQDAVVSLARDMADEAGIPADKAVSSDLLEQYLSWEGELPPVSAVLGGILANEVVKAVGGRGAPLDNFFFYCLQDGAGVVEHMAGPPPAAATS